jgi:hypothetical protein
MDCLESSPEAAGPSAAGFRAIEAVDGAVLDEDQQDLDPVRHL